MAERLKGTDDVEIEVIHVVKAFWKVNKHSNGRQCVQRYEYNCGCGDSQRLLNPSMVWTGTVDAVKSANFSYPH